MTYEKNNFLTDFKCPKSCHVQKERERDRIVVNHDHVQKERER